MNDLLKNAKEHNWEIVHFKHNSSIYYDGLFICDIRHDEDISGFIRDIAKHTIKDIEDLPFN